MNLVESNWDIIPPEEPIGQEAAVVDELDDIPF